MGLNVLVTLIVAFPTLHWLSSTSLCIWARQELRKLPDLCRSMAVMRASECSKCCSLAKTQPRVKIRKHGFLFFHFMEAPWSPGSSQMAATRWQQRTQCCQPCPESPRGGEEAVGGERTGGEVGVFTLAVREKRRGRRGLNTDLKRGQKILRTTPSRFRIKLKE